MTKGLKKYNPEKGLGKDEMLLKVHTTNYHRDNEDEYHLGFLTGMNQDGTMPVKFNQWRGPYYGRDELETYVIEEYPRDGWEIISWRLGKSQTWVIVKHPLGFHLEIRMNNFMEDVLRYMELGKLTGFWKYTKNEIVKQIF